MGSTQQKRTTAPPASTETVRAVRRAWARKRELLHEARLLRQRLRSIAAELAPLRAKALARALGVHPNTVVSIACGITFKGVSDG